MTRASEQRIPAPLDQGKHHQSVMSYLWFNRENHKEELLNGEMSSTAPADRVVCGFPLPTFQRDSVWTQQQEIAFIESAWLGLPLGTFTHHVIDTPQGETSPFSGWLIDGQQRLTAIERYWSDEFKIFGLLFSELNKSEQRRFMKIHFTHYECNLSDESEIRELYDRLAFGGTAHTNAERASTNSLINSDCHDNARSLLSEASICLTLLTDSAFLDSDDMAKDCLEAFESYDWQPKPTLSEAAKERWNALLKAGRSKTLSKGQLDEFLLFTAHKEEHHPYFHKLHAQKLALSINDWQATETPVAASKHRVYDSATITFSILLGEVIQNVDIVHPDYDEYRLIEELDSGKLATTTWYKRNKEPTIGVTATGETIAIITSQEIDGEYEDFE